MTMTLMVMTLVKRALSRAKGTQMSPKGKCRACGSTTHRRSSHRDCHFNKVCSTDISSRLEEDDDKVSENSDVIKVSEDSPRVFLWKSTLPA